MKQIYLLTIDWATDDDANTTVFAYANFEDAKAKWEVCREDLIKDSEYTVVLNSDGSISEDWTDAYDSIETRDKEELFYEIYRQGYYCNDHYTIKVQKLEIIGA